MPPHNEFLNDNRVEDEEEKFTSIDSDSKEAFKINSLALKNISWGNVIVLTINTIVAAYGLLTMPHTSHWKSVLWGTSSKSI